MKNIKQKMAALLTVGAIVAVNIPASGAAQKLPEGVYPKAGVVVSVDDAKDVIEIETYAGVKYSWHGAEDWQIGDIAALIMYDNGTPQVADDAILAVRYTCLPAQK